MDCRTAIGRFARRLFVRQDKGTGSYYAVDPEIDKLHLDVKQYGWVTEKSLSEGGIINGDAYRLSDVVLAQMNIDCLALHGALRNSCQAGWAVVAPMVLRAQLDLLLGCTAIYYSGNRSEILAFKYRHSSSLQEQRTPGLSREKRKQIRQKADSDLRHIPGEDHQEAKDFVRKGKSYRYWYSPDYSDPKGIITQHSEKYIQDLYSFLSGGAHGGQIGIRSWRDIPDLEHPSPRRDPHAQSLAVAGSNLITMQVVHIRMVHLGIDEPVFDELFARHKSHEPIVRGLFAEAMVKAREFANSQSSDS